MSKSLTVNETWTELLPSAFQVGSTCSKPKSQTYFEKSIVMEPKPIAISNATLFLSSSLNDN